MSESAADLPGNNLMGPEPKVPYDGRKQDLSEWVKNNEGTLSRYELWATGGWTF